MPYTGVYEGFTHIQVALLRAEYIFAHKTNEYSEDLATALFDMAMLGGWHPDGFTQEDLQDELDWMPVAAEEHSTTEEED